MEKINITELLKDCPKGTKLYSPIFGDVYLEKVRPHLAVVVTTESDDKEEFLYDGRYKLNGECGIFPSNENRDWSTFQIPFNDGDVVATNDGKWIGITSGGTKHEFIPTYCVIKGDGKFEAYFDTIKEWSFGRLATEEEKQKLFDAIKVDGYKWNAESKTLEKLPKFKVGDRIKHKDSGIYCNLGEYVESLNGYRTNIGHLIRYDDIDNWELYPLPDKYDITNLKPFDKVLVRDNDTQKWTADLFSFFDKSLVYPYSCVGHYTNQCIPFKGNEHLLGKTDNCDDYYKTWEN